LVEDDDAPSAEHGEISISFIVLRRADEGTMQGWYEE
jgi:hypothetical protein